MAKLKGRGVSAVNYPTGMNLGGDPSQALIHATTTGSFVITLSSVDLGQGLKTVMAQIGAETLGVPFDTVWVDTADTDTGPHCMGTFASRGTHRIGNAIIMAAKEARSVMLDVAAEELEVDPDDLLVRQRGVHRPADLIGVGQLQHAHFAGLVIDLDFGDGAGMGLRRIRIHLAGLRHDIALRLHEDAAAGNGLAVFEMRRQRHIDHGDRFLRRARHMDIALAVGHKIGGIHFQLLGRHLQHHRARLLGRHDDGIADAMRPAAGKGPHAMRASIGVGGIDPDRVHRHAEGLGADLRHHGL